MYDYSQRPVPPAGTGRVSPPTAGPSDLSRFRSDAWFLPDEALLGFVEIPAGPFLMGSDAAIDTLAFDNERWADARAQGTVDLPAYYIGRYEVTVAQFRAFVDETAFGVDAQTLRPPPGSSRLSRLMAGCPCLLPMAPDDAARVAEHATTTEPAAPRRLADQSAERGGVGKGGTGNRWADLSVGRWTETGPGKLRSATHDTCRQLRLPGVSL